jgi:hypothetical protein
MSRKTKGARNGRLTEEERIDESLEESFPASDPPAHSGTVAGAPPNKKASVSQKAKGAKARRPNDNDRRLDETLKQTFPASDPPAFTGTVAGGPRRDRG